MNALGVVQSLEWAGAERWPWALLAFLAGVALVVRSYRGHLRLVWGAVCRVLVWAMLCAMILDPLRVEEVARRDANEVVVAVDASARMKVARSPGGEAMAEQVRRGLDYGRPWLAKLEEDFRVRLVEVGERLRSVGEAAELRFESMGGNLVRAVETLRGSGRANALGAVVLVTDGGLPEGAAAEVERLAGQKGAVVYPVRLRRGEGGVDLALMEARVAQTPFEDTPVTVTVVARAKGLEGGSWTAVVLDAAGAVMACESQPWMDGGATGTVRLKLKGVKPGVSLLRVRVVAGKLSATEVAGDPWRDRPESKAELTLDNNERLIAVDRGRGPYRVLYLAGRPNWEYKFLRRALASDAEMQVPALVRIAKREPKFEWRGRTGETSNPLFRGFGAQGEEEVQRYDQPVLVRLETRDAEELRDGFPKTAEALFSEYRAIVIDDLEADFFSAEQQRLVERFVSERGGSVIMLGGQECFREGGYEHTPIGRMLPVYLDRVGGAEPLVEGRLRLTREGWLEPWMRLEAAEGDEEARMERMPGFFVMNRVFSIKPGAALLATMGDVSQEASPAVATQRFGAGRVTAVLVGDLWRWGMENEAARADLEKFWRQLFRWSVVDVPDRIEVQVSDVDDENGKVKQVAVRVRGKALEPVDDAVVRLEVRRSGAQEKRMVHAEPSVKEAGFFEAEVSMSGSGGFEVEAVVESPAGPGGVKGERLGGKTVGWTHEPLAEELADLWPDTGWMERLAQVTGGQVLEWEDLGRLPERMKEIAMPLMERTVEPLWHRGWVFGLMLGLLVTEWVLRRRAGLP